MGIKHFDGGTDGYRSVLRDFGARVSEVLLLLDGWIGLVKDRQMNIFTLVKGSRKSWFVGTRTKAVYN
jgi:hypothetical protein